MRISVGVGSETQPYKFQLCIQCGERRIPNSINVDSSRIGKGLSSHLDHVRVECFHCVSHRFDIRLKDLLSELRRVVGKGYVFMDELNRLHQILREFELEFLITLIPESAAEPDYGRFSDLNVACGLGH